MFLNVFILKRVFGSGLPEHEDDNLDGDDAQEHGEWIYVRIARFLCLCFDIWLSRDKPRLYGLAIRQR